jgi:hypothetical protein
MHDASMHPLFRKEKKISRAVGYIDLLFETKDSPWIG